MSILDTIYNTLTKQAFADWYEGPFMAHIRVDDNCLKEELIKAELQTLLGKPYVLAMTDHEKHGNEILVSIHPSYDKAMAAFFRTANITSLDQEGLHMTSDGRSDDLRVTITVDESGEPGADLLYRATIHPVW